MKKNTIQSGEIIINFWGKQTERKRVVRRNTDIILFEVKIREKTYHFLCGGEFYDILSSIYEKIKNLPHVCGRSGAKWFHPFGNPPAHITMSGYISFYRPFLLEEAEFNEIKKEFKEISPTEFLRGVSKEILLESFLEIIKSEKMSIAEITAIDWGAFSDMLPLFLTFARKKETWFRALLHIEEIPYSFSSLLSSPFGKWYLPKGKITFREFDNILEINVGKHKLFLYEKEQKIILYHQHPGGVDGYEKFQEHTHPRCRIDKRFFESNFNVLFEKRLGDLLFFNDERTFQPATEDNFEKLQVVNGIITENKLIINTPGGIVYHPEHGRLILDEGTWYIYQVPYEMRGHD